VKYLQLDESRLSVVGLGCWQFGEPGWGYGEDFGPKESLAIIRRALELGVTVLDTAELYGHGASETLVGSALREWDGPVFVASKFLPLLPLPGVLMSHCHGSLERLGRDSLDLYQLHFPNPVVPLGLQMEGLRQVLRGGLARHVGVSNFSLSRWRRAERALGSPIISNQVRYNLLQRKPERELVAYAERTSHIVIAYSPLAQGALSGKYHRGRVPTGVRRTSWLFTEEGMTAAHPLLETLQEIASGRSVTPSQIALAYLIAQPRVIVIPGAKSVAQLEANVAAADIDLSPEELLALRRAADLFQLSRSRAATQLAGGLLRRRSAPAA
jgi:aryl-alcohol dehydrogenase-like predicted oxidoreductase